MNLPRNISVTGLGYVGLTIASAFGEISEVIGFDKSDIRIKELKKGYDRNGEVSKEQLKSADIRYTTDENELRKANFHIISVPTPTGLDQRPDFSYLRTASEAI